MYLFIVCRDIHEKESKDKLNTAHSFAAPILLKTTAENQNLLNVCFFACFPFFFYLFFGKVHLRLESLLLSISFLSLRFRLLNSWAPREQVFGCGGHCCETSPCSHQHLNMHHTHENHNNINDNSKKTEKQNNQTRMGKKKHSHCPEKKHTLPVNKSNTAIL